MVPEDPYAIAETQGTTWIRRSSSISAFTNCRADSRETESAAICIVPRSMATHYARPDLAWVPIEDIDPLCIALCWRRGDDSLVSAFARVTRDLAAG